MLLKLKNILNKIYNWIKTDIHFIYIPVDILNLFMACITPEETL
jgi:hypothetical protein